MCKAPKPPAPKEPKKPQFLRNRYLDEFVGEASAVKKLRTGRSNLRIPLGGPAPITGRQPGESLVPSPVTPNPTRVHIAPPVPGIRRNANEPRTQTR
jgi:hypothetical protein